MKKIYLSVLASLTFLLTIASPDIYTPELVAPNNNFIGAAPNVELNWNAVTGQIGLYYEIQLSSDAEFSSPLLFTSELTALRMSNLFFGTQYFWRVRAKDNQATSEWSDARSFTVIVKPVLSSPGNNADKIAPNIKIKWAGITGVTYYDYQIDLTSTFDSPASYIVTVPGSSSETNTSSLLFAQKHYWRVRARHQFDTSSWSDARYFTVVSDLVLENPANNAVNISPDARLKWKKIEGLSKYNIYLATDEQFMHTELYSATPNLTTTIPDTLHFGTQYFWKMAAIHSRDTLYSVVRNFTTVDKVSLNSPDSNATNVELVTSLKWDKITGVLLYKLEFSSHPDMSGATLYSINATTAAGLEQFKVPFNLLDSAKTYYWRVKAISSRDTSNWSDTWNFRCVALGIDEPVYRNGMRVYPSPAVDFVNIQLKSGFSGKAIITLFDILGKARIEREVQVSNGLIKEFQLGSMTNGIYMLRIEAEGLSVTGKVIIKK
ncbi:MAG: T9SS type A sorting domain-containing protein [Bacteroidota bacterium]